MSLLPGIARGLSSAVRQTLLRQRSCAQACCSYSFSSSTAIRQEDTQTAQGGAAGQLLPEEPEKQQADGRTAKVEPKPDDRDMENWERAVHLAMQDLSRDKDALEEDPPYVENLAGQGQSGWRSLWEDEESGITWWELDMTGGKVPFNERNALLSEDTKKLISMMHESGDYTVKQIADFFKIRQQRVMAIAALHRIDAKHEADGYELDHELNQLVNGGYAVKGDGTDGFEGEFACDEIMGVGERHVKLLPKAPHYEVRTGKDGKPVYRNLEELEEKIAKEEDRIMIKEFEQHLKYNMGESGQTLKRDTTKSIAPRRPKEGFSLVVKPAGAGKPFVAKPDGTKRNLTADERLFLQRQKPRRRRRILT